MSTYTQILYQLIFSTKSRNPCMTKQNRRALFAYIYGVFKNLNCHVYRINGVEDHIHFCFSLHPSIALSDLVQKIKHAGTTIIKEEKLFPNFNGWQDGYSAFTYDQNAKNNLIDYIKNQEEHHKKETFIEELKRLFEEHGIDYNEKYLP